MIGKLNIIIKDSFAFLPFRKIKTPIPEIKDRESNIGFRLLIVTISIPRIYINKTKGCNFVKNGLLLFILPLLNY